MAVNIKCRCGDNIDITSGNNKVYLTPTYSSGVGEVLILDYTQAVEMQAGLAEAINEAKPVVAKPPSLSIKDFDGDKIEVGLETRGGSLVVEVDIEDEDAVWLTEAQTEELTGALEAHKSFVAQENAKPKAVAGPYTVTGWPGLWEGRLFSGIDCGTIEISNPAEPKPEPKTWTLTINLKE